MKPITRAEAISVANEIGETAERERNASIPLYLRSQGYDGEDRTYDPRKKVHISEEWGDGRYGNPLCCLNGDEENPVTWGRIGELEAWKSPVKEEEVCKTCLRIWRSQ